MMRAYCLAALLPLLAAACSDGDGNAAEPLTDASQTTGSDAAEENVNEAGCEHSKEGPFVPELGTGAAEAGSDPLSALAVTPTHQGFRVALVSDQVGWVKFDAAEPAELFIFLSAEVPFAVEDDKGQAIALEDTAAVDECTEVAVRHTIELGGAGTVFFKLGGSGSEVAEVVIVAEAGGDH